MVDVNFNIDGEIISNMTITMIESTSFTNNIIMKGGNITVGTSVRTGGKASSNIINDGGILNISGATAGVNNNIINSGGILNSFDSSHLFSTTVNSGGVLNTYTSAFSTIVSGGTMNILSGVTTSTIIYSGGVVSTNSQSLGLKVERTKKGNLLKIQVCI